MRESAVVASVCAGYINISVMVSTMETNNYATSKCFMRFDFGRGKRMRIIFR